MKMRGYSEKTHQ